MPTISMKSAYEISCDEFIDNLRFEDKVGLDASEDLPCANLIRKLDPDGFIFGEYNQKVPYDSTKTEIVLTARVPSNSGSN